MNLLFAWQGILPTRGSIMLDVVFLAMFLIVPALIYSVALVRKGRWRRHKQTQLVLGGVLLGAVSAFEIDMQFVTEWELLAEQSPYFDIENKWGSPVGKSLLIHLAFAVPTAVLWVVVVWRALRGFANPPAPGAHSESHRYWAWPATVGMVMTAVTGWIFYWMAFVAS